MNNISQSNYNLLPPYPPQEETTQIDPVLPSVKVEVEDISSLEEEKLKEQKRYEAEKRIWELRYLETQREKIAEIEQRVREEHQQQRAMLSNKNDYNFIPGEFLYIDDTQSREMIKNGWQAVQLTETAEFVKQDIDSFQFSNSPTVRAISKKMVDIGYYGHSGCSFGWTMRELQKIYKYGEVEYRKRWI